MKCKLFINLKKAIFEKFNLFLKLYYFNIKNINRREKFYNSQK